jgi:hypothetical protein
VDLYRTTHPHSFPYPPQKVDLTNRRPGHLSINIHPIAHTLAKHFVPHLAYYTVLARFTATPRVKTIAQATHTPSAIPTVNKAKCLLT